MKIDWFHSENIFSADSISDNLTHSDLESGRDFLTYWFNLGASTIT